MSTKGFMYVAGLEIDPDLFSDLLLRAKGNRTMRDFAALCGVSASTISRIAGKSNTRGSSVDVLRAIAEHSADSAVTFEALLQANGYSRVELVMSEEPVYKGSPPPGERPGAAVKGQVSRRLHKAAADRVALYKEALQKELLEGDVSFGPGVKDRYDFIAETDDLPDGLKGWAFFILEAEPEDVYARYYIKQEYLNIFYRLYTLQPGEKHLKYTVLMKQKKAFEELCSLFRDGEVRDPFSIMLIDERWKRVVTEFVPK